MTLDELIGELIAQRAQNPGHLLVEFWDHKGDGYEIERVQRQDRALELYGDKIS